MDEKQDQENVPVSDAQSRAMRCSAELDDVLKKWRCVLEAIAVIGPQGVQRSVQVVPLP